MDALNQLPLATVASGIGPKPEQMVMDAIKSKGIMNLSRKYMNHKDAKAILQTLPSVSKVELCVNKLNLKMNAKGFISFCNDNFVSDAYMTNDDDTLFIFAKAGAFDL